MDKNIITSNEALSSMMTIALRNFHLIQDFSIKIDNVSCDHAAYCLGCILSPLLNNELNGDNYECLFKIVSKIIDDKYINIIHLDDTEIDKSNVRYVFTHDEKYDEKNTCNTIMIFANDIMDHKTSCQINIYQHILENKNDKNNILLEYFTTDNKCLFGSLMLSNILRSFSQCELTELTIKSVHDQFDDN